MTFKVIKLSYLFPRDFKKKKWKEMATRKVSATYSVENIFKIKASLNLFSVPHSGSRADGDGLSVLLLTTMETAPSGFLT